jgi:hypothetical protein
MSSPTQNELRTTATRARPKIRSSLFIKVPELMGTSLLRKSVELQSSIPSFLSASEDAHRLGNNLKDIFRPLSPFQNSSAYDALPINSVSFHASPANCIVKTDEFEDMQSSDPLTIPACADRFAAPLFEHFIVVGASAEVTKLLTYCMPSLLNSTQLNSTYCSNIG